MKEHPCKECTFADFDNGIIPKCNNFKAYSNRVSYNKIYGIDCKEYQVKI